MKDKALLALRPNSLWIVREDEIIWNDTETSRPTDEEIDAKIVELQDAEPMRLLRLERNRLLQETDWRFRSDLTPSQEWIDYCQALRDLPSTSSPELDDQGNLTNVIWPTKPE